MIKRPLFLIMSVVLLVVICFGVLTFLTPIGKELNEAVSFLIEDDNTARTLSLWKDKDVYYLFLPSYADMKNVKIQTHSKKNVLFNGKTVQPDSFQNIEFNKKYNISVNGVDYPIVFMRSSNVATVYIDTAQKASMDVVNSDKKNTETVRLSVIEKDGKTSYINNDYVDTIKGHGNSTWDYDKKSYNLSLKTPASLTDNNKNQNYVLIANAIDKSNMRNKIIYDMAKETLPWWNVSAKYCDLYINGEYRGLYLLTDKVEIGENKLNLSNDSFLYNLELNNRANDDSIEDIMPGLSAELKNNVNYTEEQKEMAETYVRKVFDGITSNCIDDSELKNYIDLDSWASLYICQEFSANSDSGYCSLYFYLKDGKLYAGPLWDYDNALGQRKELQADGFCARVRVGTSLWSSLTKYDSFNNKVSELYESVFKPEIDKIIDRKYTELSENIKTANELDNKRWHAFTVSFFDDAYTYDFSDFIKIRREFLNSVWIDKEKYNDVFVNNANVTTYLTIKNNTPGSEFKSVLSNEFRDAGAIKYINDKTGSEFDFSKPITEDIHLTIESKNNSSIIKKDKMLILAGMITLVFCAFLLVLLVKDMKQKNGGKKL